MVKIKKSTRKKVKWIVIFLNASITLITCFTGKLYLLLISSLAFWVYVFLDKFNPLTKNSKILDIVKKQEHLENNNLK